MLTKAFVPYKGYYSSPFSRWQGTLANENAIALGAVAGYSNQGLYGVSIGNFAGFSKR